MSSGYKTANYANTFQGLGIPPHDYGAQAQSATQDVFTFYRGGVSGSVVAVLTINYTDATKATLLNYSINKNY